MSEVWRPVAGFSGIYSVSNLGRVMSHERTVVEANRTYTRKSMVMKPASGVSRYLSVGFTTKAGVTSRHYVHALVLCAFVGARPAGFDACHGDGNRQNNRADNLRWDTRAGNHADKRQHGTAPVGDQHPMAKLDNASVLALRARRSQGASFATLANEFGITRMTAHRAATGKSWSHIA